MGAMVKLSVEMKYVRWRRGVMRTDRIKRRGLTFCSTVKATKLAVNFVIRHNSKQSHRSYRKTLHEQRELPEDTKI